MSGQLNDAKAELDDDGALAECAVCLEAFGAPSSLSEPKSLQCGHCLCLACMDKMVCHNAVIFFIICPLCRTLTVLPEYGLQALKTDQQYPHPGSQKALLQQTLDQSVYITVHSQEEEEHWGWPVTSFNDSMDTQEPNFSRRSSIFTLSDMVSPYGNGFHRAPALWGGRYLQELQKAYMCETPQTSSVCQLHRPPSPSVESFRVCFALTLVVSVVAVVLIIIFLK